jgi:hypothetical protein
MVITDGAWRLFDYDFLTGRSVWVLHDGNQTHFRTDYPVDKLVEVNQASRNMAQSGFKGDYHLVASVPLNLAYDSGLMDAHSQGDQKFISKWMNDGDNRAFRTKEGTV